MGAPVQGNHRTEIMVLSALLLLAVAVGTQGITTQGIPTCADYPKGHPQSCKGCYSRSSSVVLDDGEVIKMEDLKVGQAVQVTDPEGKPGTSKFVGWLEKHRFNTNLVKLTTESGNVLTMTGNHGLFIWKSGSMSATFARNLSVGDILVVSETSNNTQAERLVSISDVTEVGVLAPLTESGTINVNNISTSCYASYPHELAHWAMLPARWWPHIFLEDEESQLKEGARSYVTNIKWLGRLMSSSGFRIDTQYVDSDFSAKMVAPGAFVIGLSVMAFYQKVYV